MDRLELAGWLDRVFADEVWHRLDPLPALPLGVVDDPRRIDAAYRWIYFSPAHIAGTLLAARGLQMQKKGDPEVFVKNLEIALALVRNLQNASPQESANYTRSIVLRLLQALDHWLAGLSGRPDLLRRVGDALARHRATTVTDRERDLAEYLATRNNLDNPAPWLRQVFEELGRAGSMDGSWEDNWRLGVGSALAHEADLLPIVFHLPWERERQERLLRRGFFESDVRDREASLMLPIHRPDADWRDRIRRSWLAPFEAARLTVALRHHQATTGKPATDLKQLVPVSIEAIPVDPYDEMPFRYRLSSGEDVVEGLPGTEAPNMPGGMALAARKIPAGQGILWSVGPDRIDGGGRVFGHSSGDLIYLVPLEKKK